MLTLSAWYYTKQGRKKKKKRDDSSRFKLGQEF